MVFESIIPASAVQILKLFQPSKKATFWGAGCGCGCRPGGGDAGICIGMVADVAGANSQIAAVTPAQPHS